MSVAIPEAFTFALQSRLPPNSFVVSWKEFRPDQAPLQNDRYHIQGIGATNGERVRMHLRGAPNEFLLNTNTYLLGTSWSSITQTPELGDTKDWVINREEGLLSLLSSNNKLIENGHQVDFFSGSRESFNSGALPYLDNQDRIGSHVFNRLRSECARRNYKTENLGTKFDLEGAIGGTYQDILHQEQRFISGTPDSVSGYKNNGRRFVVILNSSDPPKNNQWIIDGDGSNNQVKIPLGYYSNLVNSHSVIPLGLMSSYSVNGWSIELTTEAITGRFGFTGGFRDQSFFPANSLDDTAGQDPAGLDRTITFIDYNRYLSDIRIYAPIVQILDPAVMDSILSLYEKRQMVNLGGVQFPLSLRMNSLAYRTSNFSITTGRQDYNFRIAGTDRSVRALAWWVVGEQARTEGRTNLLAGQAVRLTRLQTKIGNEHIHEVIEDRTPNSDHINCFIDMNLRKSAALFSPLPQYIEGKRFSGQSEDSLMFHNNTLINNALFGLLSNISQNSVCYGMVSFENLDRREGDHAGSYQASGKDLTNVGSIDLDMRFNQVQRATLPTTQSNFVPAENTIIENYTFGDVQNNYQIYFAYVYDSVMEISPSGVVDITNAVL